MSRLDKSRFPGMSFARLRKDKLSKLWSILREMSLGDFTENPTDMIVLMSNKGKSRVHLLKRRRFGNKENKSNVFREKKSKCIKEDPLTLKSRKSEKTEKTLASKAFQNEPSKPKKVFSCEICTRSLSTKSNLQRHYSLKQSKGVNF